jgi:hypothetical protein
MKKSRCLTTKVKSTSLSTIAQTLGLPGKRYCSLDEGAQLLRLRQSCNDPLVLRIDE